MHTVLDMQTVESACDLYEQGTWAECFSVPLVCASSVVVRPGESIAVRTGVRVAARVQDLDAVGSFVLPCTTNQPSSIHLAKGAALRRSPGSARAGSSDDFHELCVDVQNRGTTRCTIRRGEAFASIAALGGGAMSPRVRSCNQAIMTNSLHEPLLK